MKYRLGTIRTNQVCRATFLAMVTGGLFGCWILSHAQGESQPVGKDGHSLDQPLITLWTSESALAQTDRHSPVYLAEKNLTEKSRSARVKRLPMHRLPAIDAEAFTSGEPLVCEKPFAVSNDPNTLSPKPTIRRLPTPKPTPEKAIVPIPLARERREPAVDIVDHLPSASNHDGNNAETVCDELAIDDLPEDLPEEELVFEMPNVDNSVASAADRTWDPTLPNTPTVAEISTQVMPSVQKAYGLARRGAMFAARAEFIEILRRIGHAKDAELATNKHSRALARGLRALEEADDFVPVGVQLEADFDVQSIAKSHRTPELRDLEETILPHDAIARYHVYGSDEIGMAVAGDQAGSMVLYGLGKIHSRIAQTNDQDIQSLRKSMAMYQASLRAHPGNHLAANELGVQLAQAGHYRDAMVQFEKVVQLSPGSTAFRNLAAVQRKLGLVHLAGANEQHNQRLAHWERSTGAVSRRLGVEWVTAGDIARVSQPTQMPAARPTGKFVQQDPSKQLPQVVLRQHTSGRKWPIERLLDSAKSAATPSRGSNQLQSRITQSQIRTATSTPKNIFWR